ncbi:MAG TPA: ferrous iron transport protein B [Bacteroidales bacterium]|nr:ferrous iron transport protein B [Bacteroidales bacterium]HOR82194.1 ferrous iron transport protein B [Bacteroidales bacterium]HPJ91356.1 ferrous iron transport protein B [Bacteroidales bacterium]
MSKIKEIPLSQLEDGQEAIIVKVLGHGTFRKRIIEMGFIRGKKVTAIKKAPLQDPAEYRIMDYYVSLRRSEAKLIKVIVAKCEDNKFCNNFTGIIDEEKLKTSAKEKCNTINIALVGNPNSGKTTLFNYASNSHERVGNYAGVTVDTKEASIKKFNYTFKIADLPGTYSITEYSPEELYVRNYITEKKPDIVINIIDSSNLERNLYLTTQLIDMNIKVIIALNMYDELEKSGAEFDYDTLGKMLGIPIIPTIASKGIGIDELLKKIIDVYEDRDPIVRHIHINYGKNIENSIKKIQSLIKENKQIADNYSTRYLSIKLIENDKATRKILKNCANYNEIIETAESEIANLEREYKEKSETIVTDFKYGFISGALNETYKAGKVEQLNYSLIIDKLLTNKFLGFPIFILFMWLMFQTTFSLGSYPMEGIEWSISKLSELLRSVIPNGMLKDLLIDGIVGGIGGVIVFLPNILILFFFISFMEDSGYMARASFIMDRIMHKMGLHGKSFIPMLMGFGCGVPAIMATRTLENRKDRILTMLAIPFMSCSARLPVYVLLISAFFTKCQGLILFSIYLIGILFAVLTTLLVKKLILKGEDAPFVMELPPYRIPTLKNTTIHMWHKAVQYLKKMGTVILLASIIIWALGYFPQNIEYSVDYDKQIKNIKTDLTLNASIKNEKIAEIDFLRKSEKMEKSYIGQLGHFVEPAIRPLGFDWKIGVSLITGLAAKEVVVSTMGVLYQTNDDEDGNVGLQKKLKEQTFTSGDRIGEKVFNPLVAYTLMIFILLYFPCVAAIAAIRKEANLKWAIFVVFYTTSLAWLVSLIVYQVGILFL